jgi:hypothetical protein
MGLKDRLKLAELAVEPGAKQIETDKFQFKADPDGVVRQPCWFCNAQVEFRPTELAGDAAIVMIQVLGTHERLHGIAHADCAQRAHGALAR